MTKFNANNFVLEVEHMKRLGLTYVEALIQYAEDNGVEIESIASMIKRNETLRQKIEAECADLRLLKEKANPLPESIFE